MILYNVVRDNENIEIFNVDIETITVDVVADNNCENFKQCEFTIEPGASKVYKMEVDAKFLFTLNLDRGVTPETPRTFSVVYYNNFLKNVIDTLEDTFCRCKDCDDCIKYDELLSSYFKTFTYYTLARNYYTAYLDKILECAECNITKEINCVVTDEKYLGEYNNIRFLKQLLAYYYFSFYFAEVTEKNEEKIKKKFKYNSIVSCLEGINIYCIKQKIKDMASFTINTKAYVNQAPTAVGDNTISIANRTTRTFTLADFTTNTTPAYSDPENDPADAVRIDSLPVDGVIKLNGVAVTVGQIIFAPDISGGLLTFVAPNQDAADTDTFTFSIRDTGSLTFVS